ncbi:hypothetical protein ANN_21181 [Periplaneta americana]|uniref:Uncharacterized protein n=1 Tax=Periplaneta americana TaxID=6978 RepID=A0ABQ8SEY5_PERAM|nr:hypothetical protein ANN_21181 [Periplaneta americana]
MAGLCEGGNEPPGCLKASKAYSDFTGEQSDGITVYRIPPMTSLMLHRCRTGAINLQRNCKRKCTNGEEEAKKEVKKKERRKEDDGEEYEEEKEEEDK